MIPRTLHMVQTWLMFGLKNDYIGTQILTTIFPFMVRCVVGGDQIIHRGRMILVIMYQPLKKENSLALC